MFVLILMLIVFILGYVAIAMEGPLKVDKAASALFLGVVIWVIYIYGLPSVLNLGYSPSWQSFLKSSELAKFKSEYPSVGLIGQMRYFITSHEVISHLGNLSEILFFLLGAMTIVETVDQHEGFRVITDRIKTTNKVKLLWILGTITFFLSGVLDNMTTTIVMIALLRKLISDQKTRWFFASIIVIAANAGGAFTPIGDVTTIMLWIGGQITALDIMGMVFLPSVVSLLVPLVLVSFYVKGHVEKPKVADEGKGHDKNIQMLMLIMGIGGLIFVPIFKELTDLPPYMGMLFSLSVIWITTELIHKKAPKERNKQFTVVGILKRVDIPTILFYLGILSAVAALESAGHLQIMAGYLDKHLHNIYLINGTIGLMSSIVDNVPLVAATMGMYPTMTHTMVMASTTPGFMTHFMQNGAFWELLAYAAGTGGSILIIGSAAGVVAMALEKIDFIWYMKKIGLVALVGYLAGIVVYWLQNILIFHH
ncbi:MAG: sodium:proton antiporter NhaD [Bacteroidales bacterium]|nr:sodium:proton antiporter NhaD [Bacteroidales bacterium]